MTLTTFSKSLFPPPTLSPFIEAVSTDFFTGTASSQHIFLGFSFFHYLSASMEGICEGGHMS